MNLKYIIRKPEIIEPETPILFMLHGYGSDEQDLFGFTPSLPENWIIVSFRAPYDTPFGGYSWYDINLENPENRIDIEQAQHSLKGILENILAISNELGLTTNPTHLCGFSQGGILSYALALKNPSLFNKVACLSCYPEEKLLSDIVKDKKKLEHLRFFISHGNEDTIIPLEWGRKGADLLYELSAYFTFREYISGHGVNPKNYIDLMDFFNKD